MLEKLLYKVLVASGKWKYSLLSTNKNISGSFIKHQPVVFRGVGKVTIGDKVEVGVINSPLFFNSYAYIEARTPSSEVIFGNNIKINNNFTIVANEAVIQIEDNVLIGFNCQIYNADFHSTDPSDRLSGNFESRSVHISRNVFIGNGVIILKGVNIGENSVIGAGSVVVKDIPANVIASGNPARVIKDLPTPE